MHIYNRPDDSDVPESLKVPGTKAQTKFDY